ncbi:MAG TPA: hydrogenase maturation protease [Methylocella sp.]|nr:hydrogenase maturation protease [Methylocella sp.]
MLVVIGCGNLNRSDDGVGVVVAQKLLAAPRSASARVKIFDAGTGGMEILFQARGAQKLIIIDAASSGSEPGAIFEVPGSKLENRPSPGFTLHDFRWDHALYAGRRIWSNDFPTDVTVFLIEAASLAYGFDLTPKVLEAAELVVDRIETLIADFCAEDAS